MSGNHIISAIRRISFFHLLLPAIVLTAVIFLYYFLPFDDVFYPTVVEDFAQAEKLYDSGSRYAEVHAEVLYYSGFDIMDDENVDGYYYYSLENGNCTFYILDDELAAGRPMEIYDVDIKVRMEEKNGIYENMISSLAVSLGWNAQDLDDITCSVIMDATGYSYVIYLVAYAALMFMLVYSLTISVANLIYIVIPYTHPALIYLYATSSKSMGEELDDLEESFTNHVEFVAGDMFITDKFFINLGRREVSIVRLSRIVIGYEHGRLLSVFGIHLKMTSTLYLSGSYFKKIIASGKSSEDVVKVIEYLREKYPNILWGHTKENRKQAKKIIDMRRARPRRHSRLRWRIRRMMRRR